MTAPLLELCGLEVGYVLSRRRARTVAGPLSLTLRRGELACLLGPNGAGKSTLMRTLAGMQPPVAGEVRLAGSRVHALAPRELAKRLSVVLTDRFDAGLLTAWDLVALGRHPFTSWTGRLTGEDQRAIERAMVAVDAQALASRPVAELSDGERQKVLVARALAQEPDLLVLDEITAFLDLPRRIDVMRILARLAHEEGKTILLSTHDLELALHTADTLWVVHDGRISSGLPEELVLNGAFESAFASQGVRFDRERGAFRVHHQGRGTLRVTGTGLGTTWTVRALERAGFTVVTGAHEETIPHVVVAGPPERPATWTLESTGRTRSHDTLAGLMTALTSTGARS